MLAGICQHQRSAGTSLYEFKHGHVHVYARLAVRFHAWYQPSTRRLLFLFQSHRPEGVGATRGKGAQLGNGRVSTRTA